jgi:flagellar hook-basal body complex protein FliE
MIPALSAIGSVVGTMAAEHVLHAPARASVAGADFGQVFTEVGAMIDQLKTAEAVSISGIQGRASLQEVVETVMSAEQSLHAGLAIRDKLISAYQSLSQMAI